jgi:hypothetical protein
MSQIKVICDSFTLSLSDDTVQGEEDRPLFLAKLSNMQMTMKQRQQEDDAGTFILKKMGIWKWLNIDYQRNLYKDIQVIANLYMNYFN